MRYLAASWVGLLRDGAWLRNARRVNDSARTLAGAIASAQGVQLRCPVEANAAFVKLPPEVAAGLRGRGWATYYFENLDAWRLMCSWNTTGDAIEALAEDVRELAGPV